LTPRSLRSYKQVVSFSFHRNETIKGEFMTAVERSVYV
jgi:hypothetical protein